MRDFDGRWLAVADLADEPVLGTGETVAVALDGVFASLGPPFAADLRRAAVATMDGLLGS